MKISQIKGKLRFFCCPPLFQQSLAHRGFPNATPRLFSFQLSGYTALLPLLRRIAQDSWLDTTSGPQVHGFSGANEVSEVLKRQPLGFQCGEGGWILDITKDKREKRKENASAARREREIDISFVISNTSRREILQYFKYQKMTPFQVCNLLFHGSMSLCLDSMLLFEGVGQLASSSMLDVNQALLSNESADSVCSAVLRCTHSQHLQTCVDQGGSQPLFSAVHLCSSARCAVQALSVTEELVWKFESDSGYAAMQCWLRCWPLALQQRIVTALVLLE